MTMLVWLSFVVLAVVAIRFAAHSLLHGGVPPQPSPPAADGSDRQGRFHRAETPQAPALR